MNKVSQRCSLDCHRGALVCRTAAVASGGNPVATATSLTAGNPVATAGNLGWGPPHPGG